MTGRSSSQGAAPRLVAFLRAINVGGHTVTMDQLRRHFAALGLTEVETFISSGNVVFAAPAKPAGGLRQAIENRLRASLGYEVKTFLRTGAEVGAVAGSTPFPQSVLRSAATFNVGFLAEPLGAEGIRALMTLKTAADTFHVDGRDVYWASKVRQGESKFSNVLFERTVKMPVTFRGMNTIRRLAAKYGFSPPPE